MARFATDKIIVISRQQFEEIHQKFGIGRERQFKTIQLGLDLEPFRKVEEKRNLLREEIGAKNNEILVGLVGRLTEIKNISLFLKVAQIYKSDKKSKRLAPLKFVVIGDGNLRQKLEDEAKELNLGDTVVFLGNRNDPDVFYAGLDIVAITSFNEGTPLSLIEAMANKKAVISTSVGGVVDLLGNVIDEKSNFSVCERGIRVSSLNAAAFHEALMHLAGDSELYAKLLGNGHQFVLQNYTKERLTGNIKSLYRGLL